MNTTAAPLSSAEHLTTPSAARRQILAMGACYAMGTFNDNFFKQAGLLLAVTAGMHAFQGQATFLFALPFVLLSAWAGWLADRFSKKTIIVWAKLLEVAAMSAGAYGMVTLHWEWLLAMVFCMGLNSTLFSPSLNGSIPELFPAERVPKINALFKLATTATILLGIALAGIALDQNWFATAYPFGRWLVAGIALAVAVTGLFSTAFLIGRPGMGSRNPFPWLGPLDSFRHLRAVRRDPALLLTLSGEAFFYFLSTLLILVINNLGAAELHFSYTVTSTLSVALLVGICAGSLLAARGTPESWRRLLAPATAGIGLLLCCVSLAPQVAPERQLPLLLGLYALSGVCGGLYLIPLTSFIQVRPASTDKGRILGVSNALSFSAILLAGQLFLLLEHLRPSTAHLALGALTLGVALCYCLVLLRLRSGTFFHAAQGTAARPEYLPPATAQIHPADAGTAQSDLPSAGENRGSGPRRLALRLLRGLLGLRYRIRVEGLEELRRDRRPILFLPNHPALIDPVILYALLGGEFRPRPLADAAQAAKPGVRTILRLLHAVIIPDIRRDGRNAQAAVQAGLDAVADALRQGENVLFYPSGRVTLTGAEDLGGNSGVRLIRAAAPETRLVLIRSRGLWGSSFSRARGPLPPLGGALLRGCGWLAANLLFFMPRREVHITVAEPDLSPTLAAPQETPEQRHALNRALEDFYNAAPPDPRVALDVPRHFLQSRTPRVLPAPPAAASPHREQRLAAVPPQVREAVYAFLQRETGIRDLADSMRLSGDLGVDSLALTDLSLWMEETFGHGVERLDALNTVGDCLLAAAGLLEVEEAPVVIPTGWFADADSLEPLRVPGGATIPDIVLRQLRRTPRRPIVADRAASLDYHGLALKALALSAALRRLPVPADENDQSQTIGIMLPAAPAAAVTWLAVLLAGKTPVMCNWTTGEQNLRHGLESTRTTYVLTSRQLLSRLEAQGFQAEATGASWVALKDLAAGLTLRDKLTAAVLSRLPGLISTRRVPETAAILFTSGSESRPKAVPLTHDNILANCRDIAAVLSVRRGDRMLGMLPPFHSLGLTGNIVLPLVFGLPIIYHPNPTEAGRLAALVRACRTTLLVSPPTFLEGMLRQAGPEDLRSLRLGFVGAEKCPDHVYAAFAAAAPHGVLCEGYGVTECAPVVSVNRPEHVVPGSIGTPLPSVAVAVVSEATPPERVPDGATGMLLVRGPNVFGGYLGQPEQPFVSFEGQSWYRTGDLVSRAADGVLSFRGRLKRFVKIGGEMLSLPQMESVLTTAFAPRAGHDGAADIMEEGPFLAVESTPEESGTPPRIVLFTTLDISREAANAALRAAGLSGLFSVARVEQMQAIPVLGTGKIDYRALRTRLA